MKLNSRYSDLNNRGFSLIELLAVIVILGILAGIGIGSYSKIVQNSRLDAYIDVVKVMQKETSKLVNAGDYYADDPNTVYYFDYRLLSDGVSKSPFADWGAAYVVVTYNEGTKKYSYYWTGVDKAGWKIDLKKQVDNLTRSDIYNTDVMNIIPGNSINSRDNVVIYDADGNETSHGVSNEVTLAEAKKCFTVEKTNDDEYAITGYDKSCGSIVNVPSSIDGCAVTIIEENAFRNKGITEVTLYYGIKELKNGAFQNNNIVNLKIAESVTTIGAYAFYNNKLETVIFPEGLQKINEYAFANNKLTEISFSSTLTYIGYYAFYGNQLSSVNLNSNPSIGGAAFSNNKMSPSDAIIYKYVNGATDYSTIIGYGGSSKDLVIPEEVNGVKLKSIASDAFASCGLNSVVIPDTVTYIGGAAFYNNNLKTIDLPSNLKTIGGSAFRANYLTSIDIPQSVTSISSGAFVDNACPTGSDIIYAKTSSGTTDYSTIVSGCGGRRGGGKLVIPAEKNGIKLKTISSNAFTCSYYSSITLPDLSKTDNLTIGTNAFYQNNIPYSSDSAWIYRISNGKVDYSILDSYAGTRPSGTFVIKAKSSNGTALKTINASFTWSSFSIVEIPATVTSMASGIFGKSNRCNTNLTKIINKTGRGFDWYSLTSSSHTKPTPSTFATGTVSHQSGDVEIVSG